MKWIEKMNLAIDYIEANLDGEIDLEEISKITGNSAYHFQRVFTYFANTTFSEYVRRRRLTLAAFDLQSSDEKIIDISNKYSYNSPTAFTRAFKKFHGMSPSDAKNPSSKPFTAFPPLSFQISIKGVVPMNYKIETKEAFRIVGAKLETTMVDDVATKAIPAFWGEHAQAGTPQKLAPLITSEPFGLLGISVGDWSKETEFDYYIAVSTDKEIPLGMVEYTVPASTWAIFECKGPMPESIQNLQKDIITDWLPTSGYEYGDAPDIEVYPNPDPTNPELISYVWLPIVKAK